MRITALPKYVLLNKFCELYGYTRDAVNAKIGRGIWIEGIHWRKSPDGKRMINLEAIEKWIEGQEFHHAANQ